MTNDKIEKMVMAIVNELDYDKWKELQPDLAEDPEEAAATVAKLVQIARTHMWKARGWKP